MELTDWKVTNFVHACLTIVMSFHANNRLDESGHIALCDVIACIYACLALNQSMEMTSWTNYVNDFVDCAASQIQFPQ